MIRSPAYSCFPNLCTFAKIAFTIPISTPWPEPSFSTLKRIKTSFRNARQHPMNGPDTLSVKKSLAIAKAWKDAKDFMRVNDRVNMPLSLTMQTTWSRMRMTQMVTVMVLSLQVWSTLIMVVIWGSMTIHVECIFLFSKYLFFRHIDKKNESY